MATANIKKKFNVPGSVDRAASIFDKYGDFIRLVIRYRVKSEAEAEDLFQDLFLSMVAKPIPRDVQNLRGFLYKLISDTVKDAYRRKIRYQTRIRKYGKRKLRTVENRPETSLIGIEEAGKMFDLIERRLPAKEALAVTLRFKNDCDTGEIAEIMDLKPRSVSRYVSVGLKKIGHVVCDEQEGNYDSC